MNDPLLSIAHLSAVSTRDGNAPILRDVSLSVARGEVHGLVGESRGGRSAEYHEFGRPRSVAPSAVATAGVFLKRHMEIGSAEAERTDRCPAG